MSAITLGLITLACMLGLLAVRVPIGVALGVVSIGGIWYLRGIDVALGILRTAPYDFLANWELSALPMFILMGSVATASGLTSGLFEAARLWLGRLPGGLAVATNFACAGFGAASGSSVAAAAAMGKIAIPEMLKAGYAPSLATGTVAAAGTLAALIPPSVLLLLYGIFAETSVTRLLIGGVIPGLLTAGIYGAMLLGRCYFFPHLAPKADISTTWSERWAALFRIWPVVVLIFGVTGGLLFGVVTPTEAGACGAFLAFVIALVQGRLNWQVIKVSVTETVTSTSRLLFVAVGAVLLTKFLALSAIPFAISEVVSSLSVTPLVAVVALSVVYLVLGMFLDPLGIMLITIPIFVPVFEHLGLDLVWLGIIVVKYLEIGMLTPPVGFNVYVIKTVVGKQISLETIFKGVGWFLGCEVIIMALLIAFPQLTLWLPNLMN